MNSNTQHTPGPWIVNDTRGNGIGEQVSVYSEYDGCIALCAESDEGAATATFIVTACNAHADLLGALSTLERFATRYWSVSDDTWPAVLAARAALAKVQP